MQHQTNTKTKKPRNISLGTALVVAMIVALVAFVGGAQAQKLGLIKQLIARQTAQNAALPEHLDYSSVDELYGQLKQQYDGKLSENDVLDGLKKGLAQATGDPYTVYLSKTQAKEFNSDLNGTFTGIGAELGKDAKGQLVIISPIDGFPAQKSGLRAQDIIIAVDDKDVSAWSIDEAVAKIRGPENTKVKLTIVRDGKKQDFTINREKITVPSVKSEIVNGNIGYMQITRFAQDTPELAQKAAQDFKNKNVKGVVVDLRNDGGGYLDGAVSVAGLWLDNKVVVQEKKDGKVTDTLRSKPGAILAGIPTVVLTNGGSASASEIVSGALQDHKAAKLIGEKTFGKGSVQTLQDLADGGQLKVTIARWYTPNGQNIDKQGIKPDVEVKMTDEDYTNKRDPQKDRAIQELQNQ